MDLHHDERGRIVRWVKSKRALNDEDESTRCCQKRKISQLSEDLQYVQGLDQWTSQLFNSLEVRRRAVANWKRLKIVLVLMKVCGNNLQPRGEDQQADDDVVIKKPVTFRSWFAKYIIKPTNGYKILWDILLGVIYFLSYLIDPLAFAHMFVPLRFTSVNLIQRIFSVMLMIDLVLQFVTAVKFEQASLSNEEEDEHDVSKKRSGRKGKKQRVGSTRDIRREQSAATDDLQDPVWIKDVIEIWKKNLGSPSTLIDFVATWPIFIYECYRGLPNYKADNPAPFDDMVYSRVYFYLYLLKLLVIQMLK